ncbi:von Willebrand factor, type A [Plesiocystis pacifica SIR-1]|uniref:von Willebrand factor, type A n=1 Tax=Plesiocystis pacifica SIR-1 TaxID=391625 RepID=A6G415_9BACT|nr:VIT domain-containing protein [Plesiocystis pacifica]EDM79338.1 von Willebrand factor, type A [Plesiocystis pacifica SIR-1]
MAGSPLPLSRLSRLTALSAAALLALPLAACHGPATSTAPVATSKLETQSSAPAERKAKSKSKPTVEFVAQSQSGSPLFAATGEGELRAFTDPGEMPSLIVPSVDDSKGGPAALVLEHTDVDAHVHGHVAQVKLRQRFHNSFKQPIEVRYVFPLPENAAVDDMRMIIGERTIESEVETKAKAVERFADAREAGHTAALLEQERPNVFTQSVTNVAPGESVEVEVQYVQTLTQDGGNYEFVFPMVVGPRFSPPGTSAEAHAAVSPPIVGEGTRTGHDVSLSMTVAAGGKVQRWDSPTHTVVGSETSDGFALRLADQKTLPNRDFVVRWQSTAAQAKATAYFGPQLSQSVAGAQPGHFTLVVEPPQSDLDSLVGQREMIFVIDRSGSMSGVPLALAKQTLREALSHLRPVDTFNVISFESSTAMLYEAAVPANEQNLVHAERFIDGLQAGGGTMMSGAVDAALSPEIGLGRHRYVFFVTDGFISNEDEIARQASALVRAADKAGQRARVFGMGIGSSPNRELLASLSKAGKGRYLAVGNREHPREAVEAYTRMVDSAVLTDIHIDWDGLPVQAVFPSADTLPDLYASHSTVWVGRYDDSLDPAQLAQAQPVLRATVAGTQTTVELPITVAASPEDDRTLATLWAREQIGDLTARHYDGVLDHAELERHVTDLGLSYHLVTAYTSLIAVDTSRVVSDGDPVRVDQAVEMPEDVSYPVQGQAVNMPVASSSSRDFTVLVDVSPTASRDAGGMARMSIYGESYAAAMAVSAGGGGSGWDPVFRVRSVDAPDGLKAKFVRRAVRRRAGMFEACYDQYGLRGKKSVPVLLRFDASGALVDIEWEGTFDAAEGCMESVLHGVDWSIARIDRAKGDAVEIRVILDLR